MKRDPILVEIGGRIQEARRRKKVSQEGLAHKAGLHRTFLGMAERGERNITIINYLRITTALEIDPGELLHGLTAQPKPEKLT